MHRWDDRTRSHTRPLSLPSFSFFFTYSLTHLTAYPDTLRVTQLSRGGGCPGPQSVVSPQLARRAWGDHPTARGTFQIRFGEHGYCQWLLKVLLCSHDARMLEFGEMHGNVGNGGPKKNVAAASGCRVGWQSVDTLFVLGLREVFTIEILFQLGGCLHSGITHVLNGQTALISTGHCSGVLQLPLKSRLSNAIHGARAGRLSVFSTLTKLSTMCVCVCLRAHPFPHNLFRIVWERPPEMGHDKSPM